MNTCKSCKHWWKDYVEQGLDGTEKARCFMLDKYFAFDSEIHTPEDFYCAHYERE